MISRTVKRDLKGTFKVSGHKTKTQENLRERWQCKITGFGFVLERNSCLGIACEYWKTSFARVCTSVLFNMSRTKTLPDRLISGITDNSHEWAKYMGRNSAHFHGIALKSTAVCAFQRIKTHYSEHSSLLIGLARGILFLVYVHMVWEVFIPLHWDPILGAISPNLITRLLSRRASSVSQARWRSWAIIWKGRVEAETPRKSF